MPSPTPPALSPRSSVPLLARAVVRALAAAGMLLALSRTTAAQETARTDAPTASSHPRSWEFRVSSGALLPTGGQRDLIESAKMTAAQVSWTPRPAFAITGTFGWARSRDLVAVDAPKLDAFTADIGVEARHAAWFAGRAVTFDPFVGIGVGSRSYDYHHIRTNATHNLSGYGSVGGELGVGRVGLRVEARTYLSGSKPLVGTGTSVARSDFVVMAAVRFNRHRDAHR